MEGLVGSWYLRFWWCCGFVCLFFFWGGGKIRGIYNINMFGVCFFWVGFLFVVLLFVGLWVGDSFLRDVNLKGGFRRKEKCCEFFGG